MKTYAIYFSATDNTKKIVNIIADELDRYEEIDLIKADTANTTEFQADDVCIIGVPSFGGRVPGIALQDMDKFKGNNTKTIIITTYGNRAYEDTLLELSDFLSERGFYIVGAIGANAEHSIMHQFGTGRPDDKDKAELLEFAAKIKTRLATEITGTLQLPGNRPYTEYNGVPLKPKANNKCIKCGVCAGECPVGAIPKNVPNTTDASKCISCMRCIKYCGKNARTVSKLLLTVASLKMKKQFKTRKNNELFLL